jgi:hypothetical protein
VFRKTSSIFFAAIMVAGFAGSASAGARISSTGGSVLVNKGIGYRPVLGSMQLNAGDRIMVRRSGSGKLSFADGCVVDLVPCLMTISDKSPCKVKAQGAAGLGGGGGLGGGLLGGGGGLGGLGGLGVGLGTIGAIGALTFTAQQIQENQEKKSSP